MQQESRRQSSRRRDPAHDGRRQQTRQPDSRKRPPKRPKKKGQFDRVLKGSRTMPGLFKKGNVYYLKQSEASQYRLPRNIIITVFLTIGCAIAIILTSAQITGIERQIASANTTQRALTYEGMTLNTQISGRYTNEEIEYIAFMRLGMSHPDPSQIIEINVPRANTIQLNDDEQFLPRQNYFWMDIRNFVNGILNRVFGGSQ